MLSASVLSGPAPAPLCTAGPRGRRKPGAGRLRATVRGRLEPCSSLRASVWTFPGEDQLPGGPGQREKLRTLSRELFRSRAPRPTPVGDSDACTVRSDSDVDLRHLLPPRQWPLHLTVCKAPGSCV